MIHVYMKLSTSVTMNMWQDTCIQEVVSQSQRMCGRIHVYRKLSTSVIENVWQDTCIHEVVN